MRKLLKVKKWGGENAAELWKSSKNVVCDFKKWIKQLVVVSAIRSPEFNTTDKLIELWKMLWNYDDNFNSINLLIDEIKIFHLDIAKQKLDCPSTDLLDGIWEKFEILRENIIYWSCNKNIIPSEKNDYLINTKNWDISILWFWEIVSSLKSSYISWNYRNNSSIKNFI